jgi:hypothetical protein
VGKTMPNLIVNVEGKGGAFSDRIAGRQVVDVDALAGELMIETLDGGMQSGKPSVAIIVLVDVAGRIVGSRETGVGRDGVHKLAIIAQTSVKLFQVAAAAMLAKYGDMTQGGLTGAFSPGGKAELYMSEETSCPKCNKRIPSHCRYCFNCGAKL